MSSHAWRCAWVGCALLVRQGAADAAGAIGDVPEAAAAFVGLQSAVLPEELAALTCPELLQSYQTLECPFAVNGGGGLQGGGPPRAMPDELVAAYTLDGAVPTAAFFVDDSNSSHGTFYKYPTDVIDHYVRAAKANNLARMKPMDRWLSAALDAHPIEGLATVAVVGSMEPWYESVAIARGAQSTLTVEYNRLDLGHPQMDSVTPQQITPDLHVDAAISISSIDHDGLGRYGDPLNPTGDLRTMQWLRCFVKPGGLLFVSVPVGPDVVVWNLHRRYGVRRLPLLLHGWEILGAFGWDRARLEAEADFRRSYEPVFVLRNPGTPPPGAQPVCDVTTTAAAASV